MSVEVTPEEHALMLLNAGEPLGEREQLADRLTRAGLIGIEPSAPGGYRLTAAGMRRALQAALKLVRFESKARFTPASA